MERLALPGHEDGTSCGNCFDALNARYGCSRCTGGEESKLTCHDGTRICRRHRRWIGPGTTPSEQFEVGQSALSADRLYRRLRRDGTLDAHRLKELLDCVDHWVTAELPDPQPDQARRFSIAVALGRDVMAPLRIVSLISPQDAASERYARLTDIVQRVVGDHSALVLTDVLWMLLRTVGQQIEPSPHNYRSPQAQIGADQSADGSALRSCIYPRGRHRQLLQFVSSRQTGTRFDITAKQTTLKDTYVCLRGHRFQNSGMAMKAYRNHDGCLYCGRIAALPGFNSLADTHPNVARAWHPTLNGSAKPIDYFSGSGEDAYWLCERGHAYRQRISSQSSGRSGCGYCRNLRIDPNVNSLAATHPSLALEWHPTRNGQRTPSNVVAGSKRRCWWLCSSGHEFQTPIDARARGVKCAVCVRRKVHPTTSLAATHPEVAARWHPVLNGGITPADVLSGSSKKAWWLCEKGHSYRAEIGGRSQGHGCRYCSHHEINAENSLRRTHPDLAAQFHPTRNEPLSPDSVPASTGRRLWWVCGRGHEWAATGHSRAAGSGCPFCMRRRALAGFNDLATTHPLLAAQFHPTRNAPLTADAVLAGSAKQVWWKCREGHEWQMPPGRRSVWGVRCPVCAGRRVIAGCNDMATTHPHLAAEWHDKLNGDLRPTRVKSHTERTLWWKCKNRHTWRATGRQRVRTGAGCPTCA